MGIKKRFKKQSYNQYFSNFTKMCSLEFKKQKYETNWIPFFKLQNPTTNPELATFVIGGTIDSEIIENLQKYDLSKKQAQKFGQKLAKYAISKTYKIWVTRCQQKWSTRAPLWMRQQNL